MSNIIIVAFSTVEPCEYVLYHDNRLEARICRCLNDKYCGELDICKFPTLQVLHFAIIYLCSGELDIGNATMDEKDEELDRLRRTLRERQDELTYTGKSCAV